MLQLRAKSFEQKKTLELARIIKPICNDYGVPLIINDHPIIAAEVNADGVHIGQDDGTIENVRKLYKGCRIVGRSTHSISQVREAQKEGADYIGFGPLYATATKPGRPAIGLTDIVQAHQEFNGPIYCIGGVNETSITEVIAAGATNVVIVSDLLQSDDIESYVTRIKESAKKAKEKNL